MIPPSDPLAPLYLLRLRERVQLAGLDRPAPEGPDTSPLTAIRMAIEDSLAALTDPQSGSPSTAETGHPGTSTKPV